MAALPALKSKSSLTGRMLAKALAVVSPLADYQCPDAQFTHDLPFTWLACGNGMLGLTARIRLDLECGSGIASIKNLRRAFAACGDAHVELEAGKEGVLVRTDRFNCTARPEKEGIMHPLPIDVSGAVVSTTFTGRDFWAIYDACRMACSNELHRPILTGISIENRDGKVFAVGTDTHRLHVIETVIESGSLEKVCIPGMAWDALARFDPKLDAVFTLRVTDGKLFEISTDGFSVGGTVLGVTYPNWPRVIPEKWDSELTFDTGDLVKALRGLGLFAKDAANKIRFLPPDKTGMATLYAEGGEFERAEYKVRAHKIVKHEEFAMNYRYLLDGISAVGGNRVTFKFSGEYKPYILAGENERTRVVIMPMGVS